jgi:hypothetical protein
MRKCLFKFQGNPFPHHANGLTVLTNASALESSKLPVVNRNIAYALFLIFLSNNSSFW